jgi:tetratricopeptide (TPR) repeat protein
LQGNATKAKAGYTQALAIDPTIDIANLGMARVLIAEKNSKAALPFLNKVIETSENIRFKAEANFMEGSIETAQHNHASAQSFFEQATTIDPSYPLGWFGLGRELFAQASDASSTLSTTQRNTLAKQSIQDFIQATNLNPNQSIAYMQLGMELIYIGQKDNGIKALQNAAIVVPNDITLSATDKKTILSQIKALLKLFAVA